MTWIDYVIILILAFTVLRGLWRGALQEGLALITLIIAPFFAVLLAPWLADQLTSIFTLDSVRIQIAFFILFFGILILGFLFRYMIMRASSEENKEFKSRFLGGVLGFIRGLMLLNLVLILGQHYQFNEISAWKEAKLVPYFAVITQEGINIIDKVEKKYDVGLPPTVVQGKEQLAK
jgi:membrane protein required for colicin V production